MRDKYNMTFLARIFLALCLLYCMYLAARQGIAAWYFRQASPQAIQSAIKWNPQNPEYYDALATLTHLYAAGGNSAEVVRLSEKATTLSPYNAFYWADLGAAYEWSGRNDDALRAFTRAHALFPNSPEINWKIATYRASGRRIQQRFANSIFQAHQIQPQKSPLGQIQMSDRRRPVNQKTPS